MAVVFLEAGTTSWQVPAGVTTIKVECLGAGGSSSASYRSGGAGGAYSRANALSVTPGESLAVQVPTSTPLVNGAKGADCYLARGGTMLVLAKSADSPTTTAASAIGGQASACIGDVRYSGGNAGLTPVTGARSGGGGAAGPAGPGGNGGSTVSGQTYAPGGGGANGGGAGSDGGPTVGVNGNGGTGPTGVPGPVSGSGTLDSTSGAGGAGSGGAGRGGGDNSHNGEWDASHGCGSGGGGTRVSATYGGSGSTSGAYGGGAGGSNAPTPSNQPTTVQPGGPGLIVITFSSGYRLSAGPAALTAAGRSANLSRGYAFHVAGAQARLTGGDAAIARRFRISAAPAPFGADGRSAALIRGYTLDAAAALVGVTGVDAAVSLDRRLPAAVAAFDLAGNRAALTKIGRRSLIADRAVIALSASPAKIRVDRRLAPGAALYGLAGAAAIFRIDRIAFLPVPSWRTIAATAQVRVAFTTRQVRLLYASKDNRMLIWPTKRVAEVLDYALDWSARIGDEAIVSSKATVRGDMVTIDRDRHDGKVQQVWLASGAGGVGHVIMQVTTDAGRTYEEAVQLSVIV